jgi:hypothetical protein
MACVATERDFSLWFPVDFVKSETDSPRSGRESQWRVGGIASDEQAEDLQGETVFIKGLDTSYLMERGVFNWDHGKEPGDIVGEIDRAERRDADTKLWVEGFLYQDVKKAQDIKNLIDSLKKCDSKRRLGMSLEGKIKERDGANGKLIKKAWIKAVALTYNPVNKGTFADFIKSLGTFEYSPCTGECKTCTGCTCSEEVKSEEVVVKAVETDDICPLCGGPGHKGEEVCPKAPKKEGPVPNAKEEVVKADGECGAGLKAGHDIPATSGGVSGSALRKESLEQDKKVITFDKKDFPPKKKKIKKSVFIDIILRKGYSAKTAEELWNLFAKGEIRGINLNKSGMTRQQAVDYLHIVKGYSRRISAQLADMAILQKNAGTVFEMALARVLEKKVKDPQEEKVGVVMHEFKHGELHSGTGKKGKKGPKVTKKEQAIAIALSEAGLSKDQKKE